jgi:hypothetical protein
MYIRTYINGWGDRIPSGNIARSLREISQVPEAGSLREIYVHMLCSSVHLMFIS